MTTDSPNIFATEKNPAAQVLNEALGYAYPAALRAAVLLGVADHLADGPRGIAELADRTGANSSALYRILRLLATKGVFRETEDGRFCLTPSADVLRADAPNSARAAVIMLTEDLFWLPAAELTDSVRDGTPPFVPALRPYLL
jgi:hypothetical protein